MTKPGCARSRNSHAKERWAAMWLVLTTGVIACGNDSTDRPSVGNAVVQALPSSGSGVCAGDFSAHSLAELTALSPCEEITGRLEIEGPDIVDFAPLEHLRRVGGDLNATHVKSFHGLTELRAVGGNLTIYDIGTGGRLEGPPVLETVGGEFGLYSTLATEWIGPSTLSKVGGLTVYASSTLRHIGGFSSLTEIGTLWITDLAQLTAFDDMPALTTVEHVYFTRNDALETLSGFDNVREAGDIGVQYHERLTRFSAFSRITKLHRSLFFGNCPRLATVGLPHIDSIDRSLTLVDLPALTSFRWLRNVRSLGGQLLLWGDLGVPDLHGLEGLTTVKSYVSVQRSNLRTLAGLRNLRSAGGLHILSNTHLESLRDLESFRTNGPSGYDGIQIDENLALKEIGGLDQLTDAGGAIEIMDNPKLTGIRGLHDIQSADSVFISGNPALTELDGLDSLEHVKGFVSLRGNALESVDEFGTLARVDGKLEIDSELSLVDLDGFDALQSIGGELRITNNRSLTRIEALDQLLSLGGELLVTNNAVLPPCQPEGVATELRERGYEGSITIRDNGSTGGCEDTARTFRSRPPSSVAELHGPF